MRRTVAAALLAVGLVLAPVVAAAAPGLSLGGSAASGTQDQASEAFTPGERLAGAIGTERAAFDGDVGERSFGVALSRAETNESAAAVVRDRLDRIRTRLATLEERNGSLAASYENGSLSRGAYAAKIATLQAERASLARQLNATGVAVDRLPAAALHARGVNASAVQQLRDRADALGGPAVRALARSIAGPGIGDEHSEDRGREGIPGLAGDGLPGEREAERDGDDAGGGPGEREDRGNGTGSDAADGDSNGTDDGSRGGDGSGDDTVGTDGSSKTGAADGTESEGDS